MSVVQAYHRDRSGDVELIGIYDGDRVKAHSALIRNTIATRAGVMHDVELQGPTFAALKVILGTIHAMKQGEVLQLAITTRNLAKAIDIHRAIHYLKVEPEQTKIVGHLNGYLSHQLINPDEMVVVYLAYGHPDNPFHKIFCTMIQTIAYKYVGGTISKEMANFLKEAAIDYPDLDAALNAKVTELQKIRERRESQAAKKAARGARVRRQQQD
jgi:hypothetical protein